MKRTLLIATLFFAVAATAQDDLTNLQKYWHYRYRLVHYFMVVGEGPGMSLPADIRDWNNTSVLRWGEEPSYLGYYLGVLSTEYRLLSIYGQSTDQTLTELYYALKAAIRLDQIAEESWNYPGVIDGFLIRGDVPADFLATHSAELNYGIPIGQTYQYASGKPGMATSINSDYAIHITENARYKDAISQDLLYPLVMGMALVVKYINTGPITFNNYVTGTSMTIDFRTMVVNEVDQIVGYVQSNNNAHWELRTPDDHRVDAGWNCAFFAFALAEAGHLITGNNYSDIYSAADEPNWQSLQQPCHLLCESVGQDGSAHHMAMELASISNTWNNGSVNTTPNQILALGDYNDDNCWNCHYVYSHYGWDVFYGCIWDLFFGNGNNNIADLCKAKQILNGAPWDGPYYHTSTANAGYGWCATRRFFDDEPRQEAGKDGFNGNFNGLDYMLLFNLYYLDAMEQAMTYATPIYIPQSTNPFVSDHYPYMQNQQVFGDIADPAEIFSPEFPVITNQLSVTSSGSVPGIGYLTIYGGPQGVLLTNTTVEQYANLNVFMTDFNCIPLQSYIFDAYGYHYRSGQFDSTSENELPPYLIPEDFTTDPHKSTILAYPSPAATSTTITFNITKSEHVIISIQDPLGREVERVLVNDDLSAGIHSYQLDVTDLANGIYLCTMIEDNSERRSTKLIVNHE